jgi:hypothetical protein
LEKAKKLCQRNLSDDWCKEYKEVEKYLRSAEEIVEKQQKAEREFLKALREFDVERPEESFKKLWVSEKVYERHLLERLKDRDVKDWKDYLVKTFKTLASFSSVYYEAYSLSWDRIYYDYKRSWLVVITEHGRIITSMRVKESLRETFERHIASAKVGKQELKIYKGTINEELKAEVERRLEVLRD